MAVLVHAFRMERNIHFVGRLVREVKNRPPDDAREYLIEELGFLWDHLEARQVNEDEIESRIHDLAQIVWVRAFGLTQGDVA